MGCAQSPPATITLIWDHPNIHQSPPGMHTRTVLARSNSVSVKMAPSHPFAAGDQAVLAEGDHRNPSAGEGDHRIPSVEGNSASQPRIRDSWADNTGDVKNVSPFSRKSNSMAAINNDLHGITAPYTATRGEGEQGKANDEPGDRERPTFAQVSSPTPFKPRDPVVTSGHFIESEGTFPNFVPPSGSSLPSLASFRRLAQPLSCSRAPNIQSFPHSNHLHDPLSSRRSPHVSTAHPGQFNFLAFAPPSASHSRAYSPSASHSQASNPEFMVQPSAFTPRSC